MYKSIQGLEPQYGIKKIPFIINICLHSRPWLFIYSTLCITVHVFAHCTCIIILLTKSLFIKEVENFPAQIFQYFNSLNWMRSSVNLQKHYPCWITTHIISSLWLAVVYAGVHVFLLGYVEDYKLCFIMIFYVLNDVYSKNVLHSSKTMSQLKHVFFLMLIIMLWIWYKVV